VQSVFRKHQHTAFCTLVWSVDSPINRPERNSITSSLFVCSKDVIQTEVNFTPLTNDCYVIPFPCSLSVSNNMVLRLREGTDRQTDRHHVVAQTCKYTTKAPIRNKTKRTAKQQTTTAHKSRYSSYEMGAEPMAFQDAS